MSAAHAPLHCTIISSAYRSLGLLVRNLRHLKRCTARRVFIKAKYSVEANLLRALQLGMLEGSTDRRIAYLYMWRTKTKLSQVYIPT